MDTISRENNNTLPIAGIVVGLVALIVGGMAFISLQKVKQEVNAQADKVAKIDDLTQQVSSAASASEKAERDINSLGSSMQTAVNELGSQLTTINDQLKHLQEAHTAHAAGKGAKGGPPPVAGPGEYIVKSGDSGAKIARANGCSLSDLKAVNPGVEWTKLKVGQTLKLPEKKAT